MIEILTALNDELKDFNALFKEIQDAITALQAVTDDDSDFATKDQITDLQDQINNLTGSSSTTIINQQTIQNIAAPDVPVLQENILYPDELNLLIHLIEGGGENVS